MSATIQPRIRDTAASFSVMLKEDGGNLLQEDGSKIVIGYSRATTFEFEQNREATA